MRQPINTQLITQKEIEMNKASRQRILLHENSQHRDRRPRRCGKDQPD